MHRRTLEEFELEPHDGFLVGVYGVGSIRIIRIYAILGGVVVVVNCLWRERRGEET